MIRLRKIKAVQLMNLNYFRHYQLAIQIHELEKIRDKSKDFALIERIEKQIEILREEYESSIN